MYNNHSTRLTESNAQHIKCIKPARYIGPVIFKWAGLAVCAATVFSLINYGV
jgi:hypothetical protein